MTWNTKQPTGKTVALINWRGFDYIGTWWPTERTWHVPYIGSVPRDELLDVTWVRIPSKEERCCVRHWAFHTVRTPVPGDAESIRLCVQCTECGLRGPEYQNNHYETESQLKKVAKLEWEARWKRG